MRRYFFDDEKTNKIKSRKALYQLWNLKTSFHERKLFPSFLKNTDHDLIIKVANLVYLTFQFQDIIID